MNGPTDDARRQRWVRHVRPNWVPSDLRRTYTFGVDLGQKRDHTAMAVLERRWKMATPDEFLCNGGGYNGEWIYTVTKLVRVELGTPYTAVAEWIRDEVNQYDARMTKRTVVIDGTGVGAAVRDAIRHRGLQATLVNAIITGGDRPGFRQDAHATYVSRTQLLSRLAVAIEHAEFIIDPFCKEQDRLGRELAALKLRGKPESGEHDDLAFALSLAVWWGMRL